MRVGGRLVVPAVLALLVVVTGCEAPLAPKSKAKDPAASATASTSPSDAASPTDPPASSSAPPLATVSPPPKVKVPPLSPLAKVTGPLRGQDVSWPQCPPGMGIPEKRSAGLPMPETSAQFIVIGLTNGPGFVANPCVADQVAFARDRKLLTAAYSVISGPTRFSPRGLTGEQLGYQQARFNIATMKRVGLVTPIVWLDVESVPHFDWGGDKAANAAVIRGAAKGYTDAGYAVGVYSTPYLYANVAGSLRMNVPEWRAAGQTSEGEARSRCGTDWVIQGGRGVLGQWVDSGRDRNITCPGAVAQLSRWFHQY